MMTRAILSLGFFLLAYAPAQAQDAVAVAGSVPHIVQYSGAVTNATGEPVSVKFALYAAQTGGEPVWTESQQVTTDSKGRYSVLLGSATEGGLPQQVFSNAEAKWLGITVGDGEEAPRTILVATPYSLKASDAETLAGHPATDFALIKKDANGKPDAAVDITAVDAGTGIDVTGNGTPTVTVSIDPTYLANLGALYAPLKANNTFTGNQTINGTLTVSGTIFSPFLDGIAATLPTFTANNTFSGSNTFSKPIVSTVATGTAPFTIASTTAVPNLNASFLGSIAPAAFAQVGTANTFMGTQTLTSNGTATAGGGKDSFSLELTASTFDSATAAAVPQNYIWKAEHQGNNTASPTSTLNLLYSAGTAGGAETGFHFGSDGVITFASGQTFPGTGTGDGTITGVTTTTPLSGSGTTGSVALSLNTSALETTLNGIYPQLAAANSFTAANTFTKPITFAGGQTFPGTGTGNGTLTGITTTSPLSGSGTSGSVALSLNTSALETTLNGVYAQLAATKNTFTGAATFGGEVQATSSTGIGVKATSSAANSNGLDADESGSDGFALYAHASGGATAGVFPIGAFGLADNGMGVLGVAISNSVTYNDNAFSAGVWGDTSGNSTSPALGGIVGTADDNAAGYFINNSASTPTVEAFNSTAGGPTGTVVPVFTATGSNGVCGMNSSGDVACSGQMKTLASVAGGEQKVEVYSVQAPENWFEDFGSAKLENGRATVAIDPRFAGIVNTGVEYHIFLTPQGECEGLYIASKSANGFEVRELHHGTSAVAFDYRIVAKRAGHETERMTDATQEMHTMTARRDKMDAKRVAAHR